MGYKDFVMSPFCQKCEKIVPKWLCSGGKGNGMKSPLIGGWKPTWLSGSGVLFGFSLPLLS